MASGLPAPPLGQGPATAGGWRTPSFWEKALLLAVVTLPLAALVVAVFLLFNHGVSGLDLALFGAMYLVTTLGIGMGFHRMLTHRGFTGPAWLRFALLASGSMALEGGAAWWAATHLKHHARSDRAGDPHSPLDGFWHAHVGWLFKTGQKVEPAYMRPFEHDRVAQAVSRTFAVWAVLGFLIPFGIGLLLAGWPGAWTGLLWGGLVRVFFNHHAYPQSAVHGLRWYEFDLSGLLIRAMAKAHLVRKVVTVPKSQWKARLRARTAG